MASYFVPTKFVWRFGGNQVHLCGSFTRWVETVPMPAVDGQQGTFSVIVHLPPGYHQYKFIVDGEWRHDETQPFMPDPLGNVNNWLFVRKPDSQASTSGAHLGSHNSLHSHLQQAQQGGDGAQQAPQAQQPQQPPQAQHQQQKRGPPSPSASVADMDVQGGDAADGVLAPIALQESEEPAFTRKKVHDFLQHHTAYELIPESGKVVLLDLDLAVRQAFHALHEQGISSAPLWDGEAGAVCGIISASDFIHILQRLRSVVSSGNPLSEQEMDHYTIRLLREESAAEGQPPKPLVSCRPSDTLAAVVRQLLSSKCSLAPVLGEDPRGKGCGTSELLHVATLSGVLACLMRHFRASLASLPLLAQPLQAVPLGTFAPDSSVAQRQAPSNNSSGERKQGGGAAPGGEWPRVRPLLTVQPTTPLTQALGLLLEGGVSSLPVVDPSGVLLDIFARADIAMLAKGNVYSRLQFEDVTVGQALTLAAQPASLPPPQPGWPSGGAGPSSSSAGAQGASDAPQPPPGAAAKVQRVHACTPADSLRSVVERLSVPGVRRLVVMHPETRRAEGVVSLSDVAAYLLS